MGEGQFIQSNILLKTDFFDSLKCGKNVPFLPRFLMRLRPYFYNIIESELFFAASSLL